MGAIDLGLYLASALLTAAGLTWIKHELALHGLPIIATIGLTAAVRLAAAAGVYLSGMVLWLAVLGRNQMSIAYPIGIGLSLASTTLAAMLVLGEPVGVLRLVGVGAILAGAVCISRSDV
jgi:multidrug transporter EmrE-like cation transporter